MAGWDGTGLDRMGQDGTGWDRTSHCHQPHLGTAGPGQGTAAVTEPSPRARAAGSQQSRPNPVWDLAGSKRPLTRPPQPQPRPRGWRGPRGGDGPCPDGAVTRLGTMTGWPRGTCTPAASPPGLFRPFSMKVISSSFFFFFQLFCWFFFCNHSWRTAPVTVPPRPSGMLLLGWETAVSGP